VWASAGPSDIVREVQVSIGLDAYFELSLSRDVAQRGGECIAMEQATPFDAPVWCAAGPVWFID